TLARRRRNSRLNLADPPLALSRPSNNSSGQIRPLDWPGLPSLHHYDAWYGPARPTSEMLMVLATCWRIPFGAVLLLCVPALLPGCGGSGSGGGGSNTSLLSVGGSYQTEATLLPGNTCGNVTVQNNPTIVAHSPGAQTLSITHVSINATGTID